MVVTWEVLHPGTLRSYSTVTVQAETAESSSGVGSSAVIYIWTQNLKLSPLYSHLGNTVTLQLRPP